MARGWRFHLDQDGHSVTVQLRRARGEVEVLVDGKVVAYRRTLGKDTTALTAELPGDPPRPFRILLAPVEGADGAPLCAMESAGMRYLMPLVPLRGSDRPQWRDPSPAPFLRRLGGRLLRRR
ncbi:hypothetical protein ACWGH4_03740 [Streptomyces sp. NPDC054847]